MVNAQCSCTSAEESVFTGKVVYTPELPSPSQTEIPDGIVSRIQTKNLYRTKESTIVIVQAFALEILNRQPVKLIQESITFETKNGGNLPFVVLGSIQAFDINSIKIEMPTWNSNLSNVLKIGFNVQVKGAIQYDSQQVSEEIEFPVDLLNCSGFAIKTRCAHDRCCNRFFCFKCNERCQTRVCCMDDSHNLRCGPWQDKKPRETCDIIPCSIIH